MKCPSCNGPMVWDGKISQGELVCPPCTKEQEQAAEKERLERKRQEYMETLKAAEEEDANALKAPVQYAPQEKVHPFQVKVALHMLRNPNLRDKVATRIVKNFALMQAICEKAQHDPEAEEAFHFLVKHDEKTNGANMAQSISELLGRPEVKERMVATIKQSNAMLSKLLEPRNAVDDALRQALLFGIGRYSVEYDRETQRITVSAPEGGYKTQVDFMALERSMDPKEFLRDVAKQLDFVRRQGEDIGLIRRQFEARHGQRQTGRTTEAIQRALLLALSGQHVKYVLTENMLGMAGDMANEIADRLGLRGRIVGETRGPSSRVIALDNGFKLTFETCTPDTPRTTIILDHYVAEHRNPL